MVPKSVRLWWLVVSVLFSLSLPASGYNNVAGQVYSFSFADLIKGIYPLDDV
jgi:hypothetical protein